MIIPIQHEGTSTFTSRAWNTPSTASTPTPGTSQQNQNHVHPQSAKKVTIITPEMERETKSSKSSHSEEIINTSSSHKINPSWNNFSALKLFEEGNNRWARDDIEQFYRPLVPMSTPMPTMSTFKDNFDTFKNQMINQMSSTVPVMQNHPIKIDTFASESDKYVLTLDVHQFKPEELQVKVTDDMIICSGKHEEKKDENNFSCQEYSRKHSLPPGVKAEDIKCSMSPNGVLTISAPKKVQPDLNYSERNIPIQQSGFPAIRV